MNLGDMMLSEINQTQKDRCCMISLGSEVVKNHRNREWGVVATVWREGRTGR